MLSQHIRNTKIFKLSVTFERRTRGLVLDNSKTLHKNGEVRADERKEKEKKINKTVNAYKLRRSPQTLMIG